MSKEELNTLNADVWGPHFWFVLHTIAKTYPKNPNEVTKRKYYDLIQNTPVFLPSSHIGNNFAELINKYPVTPYLSSRNAFMRWMHFIHNKVNAMLEKNEPSYLESLDIYNENYKPKVASWSEKYHKHIHIVLILACLMLIYVFI